MTTGGRPRRQIRVLVLDDDTELRADVCRWIVKHGAACSAVSSGLEAMTVLDRFHPDIVIIDETIRDGSLKGFSTWIRQWAKHNAREVAIVMFAPPRPDGGDDRASFDEYVTKGDVEDLGPVLRDYLR